MKIFLLSFLLLFNIDSWSQNMSKINKITNKLQQEIPSIGSFLVYHNDSLRSEEYFNGASNQTQFKVKSVTKSVVSALVGIAKDQKLLPDLNTPIVDLFPEHASNLSKNQNIGFPELIKTSDSLKRLITLSDLLTMQTGYLWDDNNALSSRVFNCSSDPVKWTLDLPFEVTPGTKFKYCTPATHLAGVIVSKSVQKNLKDYADSFLFKPLGIYGVLWANDPLGRTMGGTELTMKPTDMLKFGLLYLNEGMLNGKQIISKDWIKTSTNEQVVLNEWDVLPNANGYGYFWWRRKSNGFQVFVASGYGGQLICVIPSLKAVIVSTCFVDERNRGRSEIKRLHGFVDKIVKELK